MTSSTSPSASVKDNPATASIAERLPKETSKQKYAALRLVHLKNDHQNSSSIWHTIHNNMNWLMWSTRNTSQIVTLYAGDNPEKFAVHKDIACHYCPVFKAAFNSDFTEGQIRKYRLEDTTKDAIRQLINWFYTQKLDIQHLGPEGNLSKEEVDLKLETSEDKTLAELWVLAQKLLIPRLQDVVIKEMQRSKVVMACRLRDLERTNCLWEYRTRQCLRALSCRYCGYCFCLWRIFSKSCGKITTWDAHGYGSCYERSTASGHNEGNATRASYGKVPSCGRLRLSRGPTRLRGPSIST